MATFSYNFDTRIVTVDSPDTEITIQELLNDIRNTEDNLANLDDDIIAVASGKQDLGGGVSVGITLELINDWKLAFEARAGPSYELMRVNGGNLIGRDLTGNIVFPISPTAFTSVVIAQSSSATIISTPLEAAATVVVAGSTTTEIRTTLTQVDGFFRGMVAVFEGASGTVARHINDYLNTNGAIYVDEPLPFTPVAGEEVRIINEYSPRFTG